MFFSFFFFFGDTSFWWVPSIAENFCLNPGSLTPIGLPGAGIHVEGGRGLTHPSWPLAHPTVGPRPGMLLRTAAVTRRTCVCVCEESACGARILQGKSSRSPPGALYRVMPASCMTPSTSALACSIGETGADQIGAFSGWGCIVRSGPLGWTSFPRKSSSFVLRDVGTRSVRSRAEAPLKPDTAGPLPGGSREVAGGGGQDAFDAGGLTPIHSVRP